MSKSKASAAPMPVIRLGWRRALLLALVVAGLFAAYLSAELKQNHEPGFPLDDSWIHLTFARNIARGWGLAYNHGEPVAGSTAPLWTYTLAFFHLFTHSATVMVVIVKLLGAVMLFVSAVFAFRIATRITGSAWAGLGAGLAVATLGPMGWAMMSGMEVTLSVALTLAGIYYLRFHTGWKSALAWILFGLAVWARPESMLLAVLAALDSLLRRFVLKQRLAFWRGFGIWLAIVLAWLAFNYWLSGTPFPLTYHAKAAKASLFTAIAHGSIRQLKGLLTAGTSSYFTGFCVHLWQVNPVLCLLVPVGLVGLVASAFRRRHDSGFLIPLVVLGYVPLIGTVTPMYGPGFQNGRYVGNATALAAVAAVIGFVYVWRWIRGPRLRWGVIAFLLVLATANTVTVSVATVRNTTQAESCINRMQVTLGRWLAENTPSGATVACNDVGAIGYFADRRLFDLSQLVTKEFLPYRQNREGFMTFFRKYRPDFLAIFPVAYPGLRNAQFIRPIAGAELPDNIICHDIFRQHARAIAGILILDLVYQPEPVTMVIFQCNWDLLPPP
jgi:hypothetical protein